MNRCRVGFIGAVQNLEIFALPEVGDEIETENRDQKPGF